MKTIELNLKWLLLQMEDLDEKERATVEKAIEATENSYAKYSNFNVGAALLLDDGSFVIGANQENAAFPSGLCAERAALFAAQSQKPHCAVSILAIAAKNEHGLTAKPVSPCGACRQVMIEVEQRYRKPMEVLLFGTNGIYKIRAAEDLLPLCFLDEDMNQ